MSVDIIIQSYFSNSEIIQISRPKGGISADMTIVTFAQNGILRKVVVRQIQSAENEFNLLKALQHTPITAPIPLFLDTSSSLAPQPFLILAHLEGQPLFQVAEPSKAGRKIGFQLAAIHSIQPDRFEFPFLTRQQTDLPEDSGHAAERPILRMLEPLWPLANTNAPALLHGDFWPGNILWQDGELTGIIDWEDAKIGNPLQDLAISRFDTLFIFGRPAFEALTHSYKQHNPHIDYAHLACWDLFVALRAIQGVTQWAAGWPDLGRPDLTEAVIWESLSWFIQQAVAKIKSDAEETTNTL